MGMVTCTRRYIDRKIDPPATQLIPAMSLSATSERTVCPSRSPKLPLHTRTHMPAPQTYLVSSFNNTTSDVIR